MIWFSLIVFHFVTSVMADTCISDGRNTALVDQINHDSVSDDSFLKAFEKSREQLACNCTNSSVLKMTQKLKESIEPSISRDCIEGSMSRISSMKTQRRLLCDSNYSVPKFGKVLYGKKDLCIDSHVVDYVHWSVNEGLKCINSFALQPISPDITFMKLHRESKFGFFIQYSGGIGIGQLTTIAVKEIEENAKPIIEAALQSPQCESFKELLNKEMDYTKKDHVRHCQLTGIGEGIGRNIFYSLALMLHHRDSGYNSVGARLKRQGFVDAEKINYFTLISYGREGLAGTEEALTRMAYNIAIKKNKKLKSNYNKAVSTGIKMIQQLPMNEFIKLIRKESDYVDENFQSLEDFYQVHAKVPKSEIPKIITQRSLCVSP